MSRYQDLLGLKFNRLTPTKYMGNDTKGRSVWLCICDCGKTKEVKASGLKTGSTKSCGCLAVEQKRAAGKTQCHDYSRANKPRERKPWENMLDRCYNPANTLYHRYGARGIAVCDAWRNSFKAFADDMGDRPGGATLDRINNDLGYSPENCRWVDMMVQGNNRGNNHRITINGESKTISQWARYMGIRPCNINTRLYKGWSEHDAVLIPLGGKRPK